MLVYPGGLTSQLEASLATVKNRKLGSLVNHIWRSLIGRSNLLAYFLSAGSGGPQKLRRGETVQQALGDCGGEPGFSGLTWPSLLGLWGW